MSAAIIGLLGVILGSILTSFNDLVAHFFKQRGNGRYAAVRIITVLDEYAQGCVSVVADDGTCEGRPAGRTEQGEEYYAPQATSPEPPAFPDDLDWRSISFNLMYRVLSLPNTARETDQYISALAEHSFPPDYDELFAARQEGYAYLGLEAVNLVKELRREFNFPATPKKFWDRGWDIEEFFENKLSQFQERRQISDADRGLN
ncbi:MAG: hypothetical protein K5863_12695 [Nitratireductor sp.]|uniref:hypothetical protein n=1 Tax=Nitratireductor sp. TaxID=1872084 RepID=UPI0026395788|nr:hypothetical protein [Nitratireductor sp.]MCV0350926.1 hypothetical protein [Nitratireductor sp.]